MTPAQRMAIGIWLAKRAVERGYCWCRVCRESRWSAYSVAVGNDIRGLARRTR